MKKFFALCLFYLALSQFAGACCYSSSMPFVNWANPKEPFQDGFGLNFYKILRAYAETAPQNEKMKAKFEASRPREKAAGEEMPQYVEYRKRLENFKRQSGPYFWDGGGEKISFSEVEAKFAELEKLKDKISPQLFEYERGAIDYAGKNYEEAKKHFEAALNMPEDARKIEAAFMRMRCAQKINPKSEEIFGAYKNIEKLFGEGCADPQKLAFESEGYIAMWHLCRGENFEALQIYFDRCALIRASDLKGEFCAPWSESEQSLLAALKKCVGANLEKMASSPVFAELATNYLASRPNADLLAVWLEILEKKEVPLKSLGGRIALKLYEAGRFGDARRALELSEESEPLARWVKSKFLIMQGDDRAAAEIVADLIKNYSENGLEKFEDGGFDFWGILPNEYFVHSNGGEFDSERHSVLAETKILSPLRSKIIAEYGVLKFSAQDKAGALDCFLNAGYMMDAAYVCEVLMGLEELKAYAKSRLGDKSRNADFVRAILSLRVLKEENSLEGARKYFTGGEKYVEFMESLALALKISADASKPDAVRAAADWEIFTLYCEGAAEMFVGFFETSPEGGRSEAHLYAAFDRAMKAADLMPDALQASRMYASADWKLRWRDPKYVLPAYKKLCFRCKDTPLGRAALKSHWLPAKTEHPRKILEGLKKAYPY
ncbi:MAG: hypothetical protein IKO42_03675 [Opitutales bacterium]|nr:hypothetical protein [Opitutales bacterium]